MMTVSIRGMYDYNKHLFDGLVLNIPKKEKLPAYLLYNPTIPELDANILIDIICHECAAFEIAYPDCDFLQDDISHWAYQHAVMWQQLYETMCYRFTPYWNKDSTITEDITEETGHTEEKTGETTGEITKTTTGNVTETETGSIKNTGTQTNAHTGSDVITKNLTDRESGTQGVVGTLDRTETAEPDNTVTEKVAGFNASDLVNNAQTKTEGENVTTIDEDTGTTTTFGKAIAHTGTDTTQHGETITRTDNLTESTSGEKYADSSEREVTTTTGGTSGNTTGRGNLTRGRSLTEQGNIGVTATQELIQAQRELVTFDLYGIIADSFKHEFCIMIY